jgi:hypothetical protein
VSHADPFVPLKLSLSSQEKKEGVIRKYNEPAVIDIWNSLKEDKITAATITRKVQQYLHNKKVKKVKTSPKQILESNMETEMETEMEIDDHDIEPPLSANHCNLICINSFVSNLVSHYSRYLSHSY